MTTPDFLPDNPGNDPSLAEVAPSKKSKRHLLDLVTAELEASGFHDEVIGQLITGISPANQNCSLGFFAHTGGRVNPEKPNLLATIVRTNWGANRFVGPHEQISYDVLAIPDGLHMVKSSGMSEPDSMSLRTPESTGTPTDRVEFYLAIVSLIDTLENSVARQQEAQLVEASLGTDFVSEAAVQELTRLIEGPRVDEFGHPLK